MMQVLTKKILFINDVKVDEEGKDYISDEVGVERTIYGLFEVGPVSIVETPIGGRFYDSIEELDKALGVNYTEDDAEDFDIVLKGKKETLETRLNEIGYYN